MSSPSGIVRFADNWNMALLRESQFSHCQFPSWGWFVRTFLFTCGLIWFVIWLALSLPELHHMLFMHEFEAKNLPPILYEFLLYGAIATLGLALSLESRAAKKRCSAS
jgi:hypothetical protein